MSRLGVQRVIRTEQYSKSMVGNQGMTPINMKQKSFTAIIGKEK